MESPGMSDSLVTHSQIVLARVNALRHNRKLCDVILIAGDTEICAHRAILAACSSYFEAMFSTGMLESREEKILIQEMESGVLARLIDFAYTGDIDLTADNVLELLSASSRLQMDAVQNLCCDYLREQLDPHNCLEIRGFAEQYGCSSLTEVIDRFTEKNFQEVCQNDEFLKHPFEHLKSLLFSDKLNVPKEELVFDSLIRWVYSSPDVRKHNLPTLLSAVRLPLLETKFLMTRVDQEELVRESLECRDLVDEAKRFQLVPDLFHEPTSRSPRMVPRHATIGTLMAVGGKESSENITRSVESYNCLEDYWSRSTDMIVRRQQLGVGMVGRKVLAVGGSDGSLRLSSVECYDPNTGCWAFVSPMQTCRSGVAVGVLGGAMYAVGGYDGRACLQTVERFDPDMNLWSQVASMSSRRSFPGAAVHSNRLYVFGGNDGSAFLDIVEAYDPHLNRWHTIAPMTKPRAGIGRFMQNCMIGVAVLGGRVYISGGNDGISRLGSVECFDIVAGKWTTISPMSTPRDGVCLTELGSRLIAVGGINGPSYLNTAEIYDPRTDTWEFVSGMHTCRAASGLAVIPPATDI